MPGRGDIRSYYKPVISTLGEERTQSRESINFSRPMSPRNTPPTSPLASQRPQSPLSQSATTVQPSMKSSDAQRLPEVEAQNIAYRMQDTAARPMKKKKKVVIKDLTEGSHLAAGGSEGRIIGTAAEATPQRQPPIATSTPSPSATSSQPAGLNNTINTVPKRKKKKVVPAVGAQTYPYGSDTDSVVSDVSSSAERSRTYNTRAGRLLAKQPSIVREDREAEETEDRNIPIKQTKESLTHDGSTGTGVAPNTSKVAPNTSKPLANGQQHREPLSQPETSIPTAKAISLDTGSTPRHQSLSPARAAHFSSQPILSTPELRHQPPARSVSPAKSALKHSPSPRGPSPVGFVPGSWNRSHGKPASEASDTTSVISDDGLKPASRKKSVRVSFDDEPIAVGRAASPPTSPDSPMILSPQSKENSNKAWYGSGREKTRGGAGSDSDHESIMKPTPMLPSFGSIRGRKDDAGPNSESSIVQDKSEGTLGGAHVSTDQVVGGVLQDFVSKGSSPATNISLQALNDPLPPEVTSVEGTGYHSDTDPNVYSDEEGESHNSPTTLASSLSSNGTALGQKFTPADNAVEEEPTPINTISVPSIAVQPATPGLEAPEKEQEDWFGMPGGFPAPREVSHPQEQSTPQIVEHHATDPTPASIGIAEPEPEAAQHEPGLPVVGEVAEGLRIQIDQHHEEEIEDSGSSIYSDAAEDLSDLDGDGFGSINAIVESPVIAPTVLATNPPESPSKLGLNAKPSRPSPLTRNESELSQPAQEEGWGRAQQYWSGLSESRKQQMERAAAPSTINEPIAATKPKPKKKKKVMAQKPPQPRDLNQDAPFPPWPDKLYRQNIARSASPPVPAMKKSMRATQPEPSQETHMRSSMRNSAPSKSSMRASQSAAPPELRGALQKKHRPVSAVAMVDYNKTQNKPTPNHDRAASMGTQPQSLTSVLAQSKKKTAMRRAVSNGSDSSSSFKKVRSNNTSDSNRVTMRRSMRAGSVDSRPQSTQIRSFSPRSPSPGVPAPRRPFSSVGPSIASPSMRTSMRGSMDSSKQNRTKSPTRSLGFGKNPKPQAAVSKPKSRFTSRFGDSSDEDDGPRMVRSRFADSSDEDEPTGLTPVRGIPRRTDEGDSTDLDDSSAENSPKISQTKPIRAAPPSKFEGAALATGSLRGGAPAELGTGLQVKRAAENEKKKRSFLGVLGSKRRDDNQALSPLSPVASANSERPLGQAASPTQQATASPRSPASPKSPKLQRRNTPMGLPSDSWPLPQSPTNIGNGRPNTSDGGQGAREKPERPELGNRRSTGQVLNGVVVSAKTGKKKRFPMLRKAFGLHD